MDIRDLDRDPSKLPVRVHSGILYKEVPLMGQKDLITGEPLTYNKPMFIVEHVVDPSSYDVAMVYAIQTGSKPPIKKFTTTTSETKYRDSTTLGVMANQDGIKKKHTTTTEDRPMFVTPILLGVDTFTKQEGLGFFEREPDSFRASGKIVEGKATGVFITLDSITWNQTFVPAHAVLSDYLAVRDVWFRISDGQEI